MADTKTTALTADTTPASGDLLMTVDISDTTMSVNGTNKKVTATNVITKAHGLSDGIAKVATGVMTTVAAPTGAIVGTTDVQTLSSKTLTAPIIASISNTGTLTLPTSTDTLVGKATTDILTNKTLTSPVINTPTGIVKGDVGLGNVDNTSDATKNAAVAVLTNKDLTSGTNTFPTFNQNTTGSAAKLTTARTIAGQSFDGTANISIASTNLSDTASIVLLTSTQTLSNKRNTPRVTTIVSSATPTINTDNCDAVTITALALAITSMTTNLTGTPANFDKLVIRIKDDGTARAIAWGTSFEAKGVALPTTTVISKVLTVGFIYDTVTSKWGCVASAQEA